MFRPPVVDVFREVFCEGILLLPNIKKVKQSRYRPEVAQRVPGS
jgi:hypothetical protein